MLVLKKKGKKTERNSNPNRHVYDHRDWRGPDGLRILRLRSEPFCRVCGMPAEMVDHIKPINHGGDPWDFNNTQSLCNSCHAAKSAKEGGERYASTNSTDRS